MRQNIYCHGLYNDFNLQLIASSLDHLGYILYASMTNDIHRLTETDYILTEAVELRRVLCEKIQRNLDCCMIMHGVWII